MSWGTPLTAPAARLRLPRQQQAACFQLCTVRPCPALDLELSRACFQAQAARKAELNSSALRGLCCQACDHHGALPQQGHPLPASSVVCWCEWRLWMRCRPVLQSARARSRSMQQWKAWQGLAAAASSPALLLQAAAHCRRGDSCSQEEDQVSCMHHMRSSGQAGHSSCVPACVCTDQRLGARQLRSCEPQALHLDTQVE